MDHRVTQWKTKINDDFDYAEIIQQAERAIEGQVLPIRIPNGSSGSYFIRNLEGKIIGIFKPKDEEPYGRFNPRWTKWIQRTFCPCCFGRSCLIPDHGYLSEAGASLIDSKLGLNIVPKTHVVCLTADSFYYPFFQRHLLTVKQGINQSVGRNIFHPKDLRSKIGSFQLFVENYIDADVFLKQLEKNSFSEDILNKFQKQFEKLVVLDYIIRNTDRNNGNWLIKYEVKTNSDCDTFLQSMSNPQIQEEEKTSDVKNDPITKDQNSHKGDIHIAAIDNGLAFPFKHPDEWRAYPFHWAWLRQAKVPFSDEIKFLVLPLLSDMNFVQHELCDEIQRLFSQDKNSDPRLIERQLSVMRGQIFNLVQAMRDGKSPFELVRMPTILIERSQSDISSEQKHFRQKINNRHPLFSSF